MPATQIVSELKAPAVAILIGLVVTLATTPVAIKLANHYGAVDDPKRDARRIHTELTPRWGGISVYIGFLVAAVVGLIVVRVNPFSPGILALLVAGVIITIMGMVDDRIGLGAPPQALYMLLLAVGIQFVPGSQGYIGLSQILVPKLGIFLLPPIASFGLTAVYIFLVTKTLDTIDGVDGLATGISLISSASLLTLGILTRQPELTVLAAAMAGVCLGFFYWNQLPAKIFLSGGAQFVGFTLACISLHGGFRAVGGFQLLLPFTVFGVPLLDMLIVVFRRLRAKANILQGDTRHTHHQLLRRGYSKSKTVALMWLVAAALNALLIGIVVWAQGSR